jgi:hypothetical protein
LQDGIQYIPPDTLWIEPAAQLVELTIFSLAHSQIADDAWALSSGVPVGSKAAFLGRVIDSTFNELVAPFIAAARRVRSTFKISKEEAEGGVLRRHSLYFAYLSTLCAKPIIDINKIAN